MMPLVAELVIPAKAGIDIDPGSSPGRPNQIGTI
jgi:hypothetical protein